MGKLNAKVQETDVIQVVVSFYYNPLQGRRKLIQSGWARPKIILHEVKSGWAKSLFIKRAHPATMPLPSFHPFYHILMSKDRKKSVFVIFFQTYFKWDILAQ